MPHRLSPEQLAIRERNLENMAAYMKMLIKIESVGKPECRCIICLDCPMFIPNRREMGYNTSCLLCNISEVISECRKRQE
jgi:hypothetical protein